MDRYAEFVAVATADLERAKSIDAGMVTGSRDQDYTELNLLHKKRHAIRVDLLRLALQIKLLEPDAERAAQVEKLAKSQPFMGYSFPPRCGEGSYSERAETYRTEITVFESWLLGLVSAVLAKHAVKKRTS